MKPLSAGRLDLKAGKEAAGSLLVSAESLFWVSSCLGHCRVSVPCGPLGDSGSMMLERAGKSTRLDRPQMELIPSSRSLSDNDILQAERSLYRVRHDLVAKRDEMGRLGPSNGGFSGRGWMGKVFGGEEDQRRSAEHDFPHLVDLLVVQRSHPYKPSSAVSKPLRVRSHDHCQQ